MFICSKMFTRCPRDNTVMMICFYSVLRYLLLFLGVCLPVCLSLQTASLKLLPPPPPSPHLSLPRTRSQSLRDGPVSSWFWTQWRRSQPQKPLGPRAQRNSKRHQPVPFSPTYLTSVAKFLAEHNHSETVWFFGPFISTFNPYIYCAVSPCRAQHLWADELSVMRRMLGWMLMLTSELTSKSMTSI